MTEFKNYNLLLIIIFNSFIFTQNNLIIYHIPDYTIIDNKCNPLNDLDVECEYNNLNFDNYNEFEISDNTLKLKQLYKDSLVTILENYGKPHYYHHFFH